MNTIKDKIIASLNEALKKIKLTKNVVLTEAKDHGDYATNIALTLQKEAGKPAMEIAELIVKNIDLKKNNFINKIDIVKPGFINF
ncbi:Arginine--tRNA ligase [Chlamydia abortus]|jgi:arginine--tRNA ligase|nr:Arginine--tRNA ligase [Chlamydia abortus]SGA30356.1 Arginine--tRNA ligase [Chlamydia abortus]SGA31765.1 Arginine--tRNA ligase [Chlamydia abortus]